MGFHADYIPLHEARRLEAQAVSAALRAGEPAHASLAEALCPVALDPMVHRMIRLRGAPALSGGLLAALLTPAEALPTPPRELRDAVDILEWLAAKLAPRADADPVAGTVALLDLIGRKWQEHEREAWGDERFAPQPKDDAVRASLHALAAGRPFGEIKLWNGLFRPVAARVVGTVLRARNLPVDRIERVLFEFNENFVWSLLTGTHDRPPLWPALVLRAVETTGGARGPLHPLAQALDEEAQEALAWDWAKRGGWARRTAWQLPSLRGPEARAAWLAARWGEDPDSLERDLDLSAALRLLQRWQAQPALASLRRSVRLAHDLFSRARARLRSVALGDATFQVALARLLAEPGVTERLKTALRRLTFSWVLGSMSGGLGFDAPPPPPRPAGPPPLRLAPLFPPAEARDALFCWLLLVDLRGQREVLSGLLDRTVKRWGATFQRLLNALPDNLRNPPQASPAHPYARLSLALLRWGNELEAPRVAVLERVAALDRRDRRLKAQVLDRLKPVWCEAVHLPASGFPSAVLAARAVIRARHQGRTWKDEAHDQD